MSTDFITYAQNAEDVMLWRALRHVEGGFYIDVGAQDPVVDSVTKAFYERGWHGINIEPIEHWYRRLVEDRPHDVNLRVATSDHAGDVILFNVEDTGLSTSDPELAKRYVREGRAVRETTVKCQTLDDICAEYGVTTVHFLKIDCEGAEKQTLKGLSLERVRPWVVVVEATEPNSLEPTHRKWENLLVDRGYPFVYFDGLNRFYLAQERGDLKKAFDAPPTPAEWKERAPMVFAHQKIDHLTRQLAEFQSVERAVRTESERDHWHDQARYWSEENARREHALTEFRTLVDALRKESRSQSDEVERLRREFAEISEERAISDLHNRELQSELTGLKQDLAKVSEVRTAAELHNRALRLELAERVGAIHRLNQEIMRLQREAVGLLEKHAVDGEEKREFQAQLARQTNAIAVLEVEIEDLRRSHSWRMTAPLRAIRRVLDTSLYGAWRFARPILRPVAHSMRPTLRQVSQFVVLRRLAGIVFGRQSIVMRHARLFLFGRPPRVVDAVAPSTARPDEGIELDPSNYSRRQRKILQALHDADIRTHERSEPPCA